MTATIEGKEVELQGSCGVCLREEDHQEPDGRYVGTDPIAVVRCSNGCRGCEKCVKPCEEGSCSLALCQDCSEVCEGCGERFCEQHIIQDPNSADYWCGECCPWSVKRATGKIAAVIED